MAEYIDIILYAKKTLLVLRTIAVNLQPGTLTHLVQHVIADKNAVKAIQIRIELLMGYLSKVTHCVSAIKKNNAATNSLTMIHIFRTLKIAHAIAKLLAAQIKKRSIALGTFTKTTNKLQLMIPGWIIHLIANVKQINVATIKHYYCRTQPTLERNMTIQSQNQASVSVKMISQEYNAAKVTTTWQILNTALVTQQNTVARAKILVQIQSFAQNQNKKPNTLVLLS